jgi:hypothetical protein
LPGQNGKATANGVRDFYRATTVSPQPDYFAAVPTRANIYFVK